VAGGAWTVGRGRWGVADGAWTVGRRWLWAASAGVVDLPQLMIALWSVVLFVALWLLLAGFGVVVVITIRRLERDDGPWRRGL
jgi:hypothetical protein